MSISVFIFSFGLGDLAMGFFAVNLVGVFTPLRGFSCFKAVLGVVGSLGYLLLFLGVNDFIFSFSYSSLARRSLSKWI